MHHINYTHQRGGWANKNLSLLAPFVLLYIYLGCLVTYTNMCHSYTRVLATEMCSLLDNSVAMIPYKTTKVPLKHKMSWQ